MGSSFTFSNTDIWVVPCLNVLRYSDKIMVLSDA